jgi:hypothetical protein
MRPDFVVMKMFDLLTVGVFESHSLSPVPTSSSFKQLRAHEVLRFVMSVLR